jgi:hypothetical protein
MEKVKRYTTQKIILAALFIALIVAQGVTLGLLHQTNQDVQSLKDSNQIILNELDSTASLRELAAVPGQKRLYVPELNITLPLDETTSTMRYTYTTYGESTSKSGDARITTTMMTDHTTHVKSCSDMVRLKIEAKPDAYSPDQPVYASIKLADGRTLQVYASTAKECERAWLPLSPQALAEPFKQAQSY